MAETSLRGERARRSVQAASGRPVKRRAFRPPRIALSLFWRTFILLAMLLGGGIFAWMQTFRALEFDPFDRSLDVQIARLRKMIELHPAEPS